MSSSDSGSFVGGGGGSSSDFQGDGSLTINRAEVAPELDRRVRILSQTQPGLLEADRAARNQEAKIAATGDLSKPLFVLPTFKDRDARFNRAFDRLDALVTKQWQQRRNAASASVATGASGEVQRGTEGAAVVDITFAPNPSTKPAGKTPSAAADSFEQPFSVDASTTPNTLETYVRVAPEIARKAGLPLRLSSDSDSDTPTPVDTSDDDSDSGGSFAEEDSVEMMTEEARPNNRRHAKKIRQRQRRRTEAARKKKGKGAANEEGSDDPNRQAFEAALRDGESRHGMLCNIIQARFSIRRTATEEEVASALASARSMVKAAGMSSIAITFTIEEASSASAVAAHESHSRTLLISWGMYDGDLDPIYEGVFSDEQSRASKAQSDASFISASGGRASLHTQCSFDELFQRPEGATEDAADEAVGLPFMYLLSGARLYADGAYATRLLHEYQYDRVKRIVENGPILPTSSNAKLPGVTTFAFSGDIIESVGFKAKLGSPALAVARVIQSWSLALRQVYGQAQQPGRDVVAAPLATSLPEFSATYLASESLGLNLVPQVLKLVVHLLTASPEAARQYPFSLMNVLDALDSVSLFTVAQHLQVRTRGVPVRSLFPGSAEQARQRIVLACAARHQHFNEAITGGAYVKASRIQRIVEGIQHKSLGEALDDDEPPSDEEDGKPEDLGAAISAEVVSQCREVSGGVAVQERDMINDAFLEAIDVRINSGLRPLSLPGETQAGMFTAHLRAPIVILEDAARATGRRTILVGGEPRIGKRTLTEAWTGAQGVPSKWFPYDPQAPRRARIGEEKTAWSTRRLPAGERGRTANVDVLTVRMREGDQLTDAMQAFSRLAAAADVLVFVTTGEAIEAAERQRESDEAEPKSALGIWFNAAETVAEPIEQRPFMFRKPTLLVVRDAPSGSQGDAMDVSESRRIRRLTSAKLRLIHIASGDTEAPNRVLNAALGLAERGELDPPLSVRDIAAILA